MPPTSALDAATCLTAVRSRDGRFDGQFVTAVTSTGIYCRPSCPARTPKPENVRFLPTAAAAQEAGFRACKRCRPDAAPGSPQWDARADLTARAVRMIGDGVVDRGGVAELAAGLGYSVRQVQRHLRAELGAGPLALARAQRAHTARQLIESTAMPLADVAFAAGFASVRQFNETVREVYGVTPGQLRERPVRLREGMARDGEARDDMTRDDMARDGQARDDVRPAAGAATRGLTAVELRLPFRPPLHPDNLFGHLVATAVPGVEEWRDGALRVAVGLPHAHGIAALRPPTVGQAWIPARLLLADLRDLPAAIARCRRLLDLDADPVAVDDHLSADEALRPLVAAAPGRRVPRSTDAADLAVRAVLGQQVSTAAAATHAGRLARALGQEISDPEGGLTHLFPEPGAIGALDPATLALPRSRGRTLVALAAALAEGAVDLGVGCDRAQARAQLAALPGIGPWTVEVVAMRGLGDPDAYPAGDLGVRRAVGALEATSDPRRWSPWRAYAVQHLWATGTHAVNQLPRSPEEVR